MNYIRDKTKKCIKTTYHSSGQTALEGKLRNFYLFQYNIGFNFPTKLNGRMYLLLTNSGI